MQFTSARQREAGLTHRRLATEVAAFRESADGWFDGTPHSVDRRLGQVNRLLVSARSSIVRNQFDWEPIQIIAELEADHRALVGIREDLLTGGANRVVAFSPPDPPSHINEDLKPQWRQDVESGVNPMERHLPEHLKQAGGPPTPPAYSAPRQGPTPWDHEADDWATPSLEQDMTGGEGYRSMPSAPKFSPGGTGTPSGPYKGPDPSRAISPEQAAQFEDIPHLPKPTTPGPQRPRLSPEQMKQINEIGNEGGGQPHDPRKFYQSSLAGDEIRWVTLESSRFVQANTDCVGYLSELVTRAQNHAGRQLSTASNRRAITSAFLAAVIENARKVPAPRPAQVRTAAFDPSELDDAATWL